MDAKAKFAVAVTRLTDEKGIAPYLASVFSTLVRRESGQVPTLAVSKNGVLYWGRAWVDETAPEIIAWGLFHEAMHVLLGHFDRAEVIGAVGEKAPMANIAQDACINESLRDAAKKAGVSLPNEWVYPETLQQPEKLVFEERYRLLEQKQKPQPKSGKGVGAGQCGSCCGNPTEGEEPGGGDGGGRSVAEMDRMKRTVAEAIQSSQNRGTMPNDLARWADDFLAPAKVDWRTKLASCVRDAIAYRPGAVDLHWTRPSRRQGGLGFGVGRPVMPAYRAPVPEVAVIIDTSGSMSQGQLVAAASEIEGILRAVAASVTIVTIDAQVHGIKKVRTIQEACGMMVGGGGTDMTDGFLELEKTKPKPELIVCCTDGHLGGGYPKVEPAWTRTIWCVIGGGAAAPWGTRIEIDDDGAHEKEAT